MSLPSSPEPEASPSCGKSPVNPSFTEAPVKWLYKEVLDMAEETTDHTKSDVAPVTEAEKAPERDAATGGEDGGSSDEEIDVTEEISKQVSYIGNVLSSAWSKTAKTASEVTSSAAAASLLKALGGPIRPVDDEDEAMKAEDAKEVEEVPASLPTSSSTFFSNAWSKVEGLAKSTSWTGGELAKKDGDDASAGEDQNEESPFDFSSIVKAATSATTAIRETVGQLQAPTMLTEFDKKQDEFIKTKEAKVETGIAPWVGYRDEQEMKAKVVALSADKRTFVRAPPSGVSFDFDYSSVSSIALALLEEDENLKAMRYSLVPKTVKEDAFWRNYFYRVSLIKQSFDLKDFDESSDKAAASPAGGGGREPVENRLAASPDEGDHDNDVDDDEFVSDSYQASSKDMAEVDESMKRLGVGGGGKGKATAGGGGDDNEWEAELEGELNEFEIVSSKSDRENSPEWDNQIQELLDAEDSAK